MPELPEAETVRRGLAPVMEGARFERVLLARPDLRFPFPERFAERLTGRTVTSLSRRAKYLLADLDSGEVLVMHLGMSGSFRIHCNAMVAAPGAFHMARSKDIAHDHVVFDLSSGARIVYNDPRRFGFMTLADRRGLEAHPLFRHLGPEPLGNEMNGAMLAARLCGKATSLKAALGDQTVVAGLGNIYVCEALHKAKLSPRRIAGTLARRDGGPTAKAERLAAAIRSVLEAAIAAGGSTLRDHVRTDGTLGYFQHSFAVYDRQGEPCPRPGCRGIIERIVQGGRSTFFCPVCQR